ncbi:hypothetical protein [Streptomyces parvus]|uniref:hypothetical protein n=1 Tax=Streptomyces parvus TaxID=66428 RepID=UPI002101C0CA|nr:hypothetical protein [Streptomyces parvus]MCQ1577177.1 hypothetical protein [Streptomyces parvus]
MVRSKAAEGRIGLSVGRCGLVSGQSAGVGCTSGVVAGSGLLAVAEAKAPDDRPAYGPDRAAPAVGACRTPGSALATVLGGRSPDEAPFLGFAQSFLHLGMDGFRGVMDQSRLSGLVRCREASGNVILSVTGSVGGNLLPLGRVRGSVPPRGKVGAVDVLAVSQSGSGIPWLGCS